MCRQDFGPNLKSAGSENLLETKPGTNINTAPDGSVIINKPVEKQSMSDCKAAGVPASFGQLVIRCGKGVARLGDTVSCPCTQAKRYRQWQRNLHHRRQGDSP